ncbi:hypothetical protein [Nocardia nepalensis]|uniref:hypothetical protein n=1 Tax=Nocardia nepalensis TaxID=3375448 RepID=UPI003B674D81
MAWIELVGVLAVGIQVGLGGTPVADFSWADVCAGIGLIVKLLIKVGVLLLGGRALHSRLAATHGATLFHRGRTRVRRCQLTASI